MLADVRMQARYLKKGERRHRELFAPPDCPYLQRQAQKSVQLLNSERMEARCVNAQTKQERVEVRIASPGQFGAAASARQNRICAFVSV